MRRVWPRLASEPAVTIALCLSDIKSNRMKDCFVSTQITLIKCDLCI